jgi:hypothetical protein
MSCMSLIVLHLRGLPYLLYSMARQCDPFPYQANADGGSTLAAQ